MIQCIERVSEFSSVLKSMKVGALSSRPLQSGRLNHMILELSGQASHKNLSFLSEKGIRVCVCVQVFVKFYCKKFLRV